MYNQNKIEEIWSISKDKYAIQQVKEEWLWMIDRTVNQWENKKDILEIGCYDGGTSFFLSNFANEMISIDEHNPARFDTTSMEGENFKYIGGDSHLSSTLNQINDKKWNYAFIDGDHSYEGVKADFHNILPFMDQESYMVFHDIVISDFHHEHKCFVGEFWEEVKKDYKYEEYKTNDIWGGIGILFL